MTEIIVSIISSITAISVAVIGAINLKHRRTDEHKAEIRSREFRLGMEMQAACIELSDVIAISISGEKFNQDIENARRKAQDAKGAYYAFLKTVAADALTQA
jgi:hypothetical protein